MLKNVQVLFRLKNKYRIALLKESHLVSEAFLSIHVVGRTVKIGYASKRC